MKQRILKTIKRLFFPLAVIFIATSFTGAYFSDSVAITNNTFSTGERELTPGKVVISEVFYDNGSSTADIQWVELYNGGDLPFGLTGYHLYYGYGNYYTFPTFTLNGKSFVVIRIHAAGIDSSTNLYTGTISLGEMDDTAGEVFLFHNIIGNSGTPVDYVQYGAGGHTWEPNAVAAGIWTAGDFVPDVSQTHSIELIDKNIDTNRSVNWHEQSVPTAGS